MAVMGAWGGVWKWGGGEGGFFQIILFLFRLWTESTQSTHLTRSGVSVRSLDDASGGSWIRWEQIEVFRFALWFGCVLPL